MSKEPTTAEVCGCAAIASGGCLTVFAVGGVAIGLFIVIIKFFCTLI